MDGEIKGKAKGGHARAASLTPEQRKEIAQTAAAARWSSVPEDIPKAICGAPDRPLKIGDVEIPAYVLEGEKRVLVQRGMMTAFDMKQGTAGRGPGDRLAKFIDTKAIKPFISNEIAEVIKSPIKFKTTHGSVAYGYEATLIADLCDAILAARKAGKLHYQQKHIADKCEILLRGFARVGIIALVDEATGYQEMRDHQALHKIIDAYVVKEFRPWAKKFDIDFYREMFRLRGWQFYPHSVKRPKLVAKLTTQITYDRLPPGIKEEIQRKNPKSSKTGRYKHKYFQYLTDDLGIPHLDKLYTISCALMKIASDWRHFMDMYDRAVPKPGTTPPLFPLENDE
jgi:hypothetical protein